MSRLSEQAIVFIVLLTTCAIVLSILIACITIYGMNYDNEHTKRLQFQSTKAEP